jgi:hypothetical protein
MPDRAGAKDGVVSAASRHDVVAGVFSVYDVLYVRFPQLVARDAAFLASS